MQYATPGIPSPSPSVSSLLVSTSLPPSPSSWQKVGREPAFLSTTLTCLWVEVGGGGGGGGTCTGAAPAAAAREAGCAAARAFAFLLAARLRFRFPDAGGKAAEELGKDDVEVADVVGADTSSNLILVLPLLVATDRVACLPVSSILCKIASKLVNSSPIFEAEI